MTRMIFTKLVWLTTILAMTACGKEAAAPEEKEGTRLEGNTLMLTERAAANADIATQKTAGAEIAQAMSYQGEVSVIPEKFAAIVARLEGVVTVVSKKEGDRVTLGEAMVTIESKKLAEAKLAYLEAEQKYRFAKTALARETELVEKKISSKEAFQQAEHQKEEAELAHAAALQQLKLLGFSEQWLHKLEDNPNQKMTSYTLRAPFDGEVISKEVTMGEAVAEDKQLFRLADLSELLVEIQVPLTAVSIFQKDMTVTVTNESLNMKSEGTVAQVSSVANPETRTVTIKVTIKNEDGAWRPGMPATVELVDRKVHAKVAVPLGAVHEMDGKTYVFVQTSPTAYRRAPVTIGASDDNMQEIVEGLAPGDLVAVANSLTLKSEWMKQAGE
ncbi:MAG: efflux RND transporter periplasmic adaptor subunit [Deltaproteobacteria bacterium]|nr:efflux RND transporter periplasmic adaptor subunit [Deltaproteobacteria bacterium]MBN2670120.1 efflux RND transporter periplasmic adaptor subunit [Deltaproteobacteria bacterium]